MTARSLKRDRACRHAREICLIALQEQCDGISLIASARYRQILSSLWNILVLHFLIRICMKTVMQPE